MQINRLFEIVYILLEHQCMTAKELANRFEVSVRTIYRDIDAVSYTHLDVYKRQMLASGSVVNPTIYNADTRGSFGLNITLQMGDKVTINTCLLYTSRCV